MIYIIYLCINYINMYICIYFNIIYVRKIKYIYVLILFYVRKIIYVLILISLEFYFFYLVEKCMY